MPEGLDANGIYCYVGISIALIQVTLKRLSRQAVNCRRMKNLVYSGFGSDALNHLNRLKHLKHLNDFL